MALAGYGHAAVFHSDLDCFTHDANAVDEDLKLRRLSGCAIGARRDTCNAHRWRSSIGCDGKERQAARYAIRRRVCDRDSRDRQLPGIHPKTQCGKIPLELCGDPV